MCHNWQYEFTFVFCCVLFQLSYASSSPILSDRKRFPNFFRLTGPDQQLNPAKVAMMKKFNWNKVATINQALELFSLVNIMYLTWDTAANLPSPYILSDNTEYASNKLMTAFLCLMTACGWGSLLCTAYAVMRVVSHIIVMIYFK